MSNNATVAVKPIAVPSSLEVKQQAFKDGLILLCQAANAQLRIVVGTQKGKTGNVSPAYATIKVPGKFTTLEACLKALAAESLVKVTLPKYQFGQHIALQLNPEMSGEKAACLIVLYAETLDDCPLDVDAIGIPAKTLDAYRAAMKGETPEETPAE